MKAALGHIGFGNQCENIHKALTFRARSALRSATNRNQVNPKNDNDVEFQQRASVDRVRIVVYVYWYVVTDIRNGRTAKSKGLPSE
ncbi:hypothetical protein OUZ56_003436 [Daphnia magna]|uniref:Uncharacterized protein n=1 Tax=Daphnia magna TaxID=35525 RepID=A0ABR0A8Q9_9CRUS|nr:hypothetical protein OUZ56_003436 [Daphnia magna]